MIDNSMKPVDVGAARLIPQGNLTDHPASFAGIRKQLDSVDKSKITTIDSKFPNFVPGYYNSDGSAVKGLENGWQTTTIK